ncbi:fatty acyl-AMP ligase [Mycolicibacterium sediminis]|uniref:Nitrate ABC transporter substrate-binding protein n=1 Tax=Mycolicibacterium sediminis TaxID=1286180 RepID=A0A7I7QW70_9MYCO|nr:nitrate ABC transporter substrate-binding protein [Mycolicibacterium sediminis]
MVTGVADESSSRTGLLRIEDCLDARGGVVLPPGVNLISLIERNIAAVGENVAYRYLDHTRSDTGQPVEITWRRLGVRLAAVAAEIQRFASHGDRVAILAPQGIDYVVGFFAAIKAGTIAVPLFAPELQGHAERLGTAFADATPALVLATDAARASVEGFLNTVPASRRPRVLSIDGVADAAGDDFTPQDLDLGDVSHLQFTSGATRAPVGVEVTHRAVGTNLIQMILSIDLLDRNTHGLSWLPLYHDMGLSMIGFPAVYGGHSTLMSPTAFIRRPQRWIRALSDGGREGRVITAAPNFAYEWTAQRGRPGPGDDVDLSNAVMIIGSEPVSSAAIETFTEAFAPYGLSPTAFKPSYGIAEATLFVATIGPDARPTVLHADRDRLTRGDVVPVSADAPEAVELVSCGQVARSQWCVIVDPETGAEVADGTVGEPWLHGANVGRGYWGRPEETRHAFAATVTSRRPDGHAGEVPADAAWLRTGDLGFYLDGELYVLGRLADVVAAGGRRHDPHDLEATAANASALVRRGYAAAFTASDDDVVIVAERATGAGRADPAPAAEAIRAAVADRHGV